MHGAPGSLRKTIFVPRDSADVEPDPTLVADTTVEPVTVATTDGPIADDVLQVLMLQARRTQDTSLQQLVLGYLTLRRVTADVVALIATREGGAAVAATPLLRRARQLSGRA
jgi:hypothetical protein